MNIVSTTLAMLILYKIICLFVGLSFAYMGYRLFSTDPRGAAPTAAPASDKADLKLRMGDNQLTLAKAAPGTFFALFGAAVISLTILRGVTAESPSPMHQPTTLIVPNLLPESPPFSLEEHVPDE